MKLCGSRSYLEPCTKEGDILQNKKRYLRQAYKLNEQIREKQDRLAELKEMSCSVGAIDYSKDKVQGGSGTNAPFENQVIQVVDLEKEIEQDILKLIHLQSEIMTAIDAVPDVNCALLLDKRYVLRKPWKQIADEMHYSMTHIKRIHRKALELFVIPNNDGLL